MDEKCSNQSNVYINNFGVDLDDKKLHDLFQPFGRIRSAKVMHDDKGLSRGFGFVQFEDPKAAEKAIEAVNGLVIGNKTLYCGYAQRKAERRAELYKKYKDVNLYVGNLHENVDEKELHKLFSHFGTVTSAKVQYKNGKSQGYGFVSFENPHAAEMAIKTLDGHNIEGKEIYCTYFQTKAERHGVNLFVKNLHDQIDDAKLRDLFSRFGKITSAKVMKENGVSKNFGFVCFSSPEAAAMAIAEMNNKFVCGKALYVGLHQKKEDRQTELCLEKLQRFRLRLEEKAQPSPVSINGRPDFMNIPHPRPQVNQDFYSHIHPAFAPCNLPPEARGVGLAQPSRILQMLQSQGAAYMGHPERAALMNPPPGPAGRAQEKRKQVLYF